MWGGGGIELPGNTLAMKRIVILERLTKKHLCVTAQLVAIVNIRLWYIYHSWVSGKWGFRVED